MPHLDEGTLSALFDGELARDERDLAERHLTDCGECRRLYEEIRAFAGEAGTLVDSLQPEKLPGQDAPRVAARPGWDRFRPLAWAATLVLAAGLGWSASARRFPQAPADSPAAGSAERVVPTISTVPDDKSAGEPRPEERAPTRARQDESSRRQVTQPPTPSAVGAAKVATPAPPAEADAALANQASRAESAAPGAPASGLTSQPRQARAAELPALRDAPASVGGYREAPLEEAVRALGGTVKLIDGLNPIRVQLGPAERVAGGTPIDLVRVTYLDPPGRELWLDQQRSPSLAEGGAAPAPAGEPAGGGYGRVRRGRWP